MGYTTDKSSPYYYGLDSTYRPAAKKTRPERKTFRPTSPMLADDPELMTQAQFNNGSSNPTRPSQPTGGNIINAFGGSYNMSDPQQASAYNEKQQAELDRQRGFSSMSDIRGGDGVKSDGSRHAQPTGRGESRTSPTGVEQKGTNTGIKPMTLGDANALLTGGYAIQDPFSSNQLPTTGSSLYQKAPETNAFEQNPQYNISTESTPTKLSQNIYESGSALEMKDVGDKYQVSVASAPTSSTVKADIKGDSKEDPKNSGINWGARTAADNSDPNVARRRAFLDAEGSMQGLRRAEATQGLVYAGGQHHIMNPNRGQEGQNDFVAIDDKDDVRGYKSGRLSAEDIKNKYVTNIMESNSNSNTTQAEGGAAYNPQLVSQTAGPLADGDAYGITLQQQSNNTGVSGIGPIADGKEYASNLDKIKKVRASKK